MYIKREKRKTSEDKPMFPNWDIDRILRHTILYGLFSLVSFLIVTAYYVFLIVSGNADQPLSIVDRVMLYVFFFGSIAYGTIVVTIRSLVWWFSSDD